ncbi:MAG: succinate dehydrogenase/fumarate reductase iron-sulfur subunit [Desulfobulbaceae bacterium A2]|nr:MAG: succinate dehydrogenase/fumarate reductase iron-sulfur subunit [Desulfobulbaceae bacterium A2]
MSERNLSLTLEIWRQPAADQVGAFEKYTLDHLSSDMSFLEMLDVLNERLTLEGKEPVAFDHDCREGICGMCGTLVNGVPHGPESGTTLCQLHMRHFRSGETIVIEPFRARAFPVLRDLMVDRSALDRVIQAGGYVSVNTGSAPEANTLPVPQRVAEEAMDAAACIGCGACVASCPNAAAMLFTGAKVSQLALLPQGGPERARRALALVRAMDREGFGSCGNHRECEAVCPKQISIRHIARFNREYLRAALRAEDAA